MPPKRGDLFWVNLDPVKGSEQGGRRPVLVISRNSINDSLPYVVVLPLSSSPARLAKPYPSQLVVRARELGMDADGVVMGEQIRNISRERLERYISHLGDDVMQKVNELVKVVLALK
ncbi:MAG TPA: type II toxin-antitoxin system PemK/MazF family toxin [Candidatus Sulfotelmatobacter sp.]|nr:type II toxin-antitoxin system PemK/MazF family toxin [Candidatus Sulfotelmatobacter sp.]